jgi:hypothetical protein
MKNLGQFSRSLGRDLNAGPHEHYTGVQATRLKKTETNIEARPVTVEARLRARISPCGICSG